MAFLRSILVASAVGSHSPLSRSAFESAKLLYICRAQQQSHQAEPAAMVLKSCLGACVTLRIVVSQLSAAIEHLMRLIISGGASVYPAKAHRSVAHTALQ